MPASGGHPSGWPPGVGGDSAGRRHLIAYYIIWHADGSYTNAMGAAEIFMGLWLFPLGLLVFRSGFLPRILGVLLFVAGTAYLADSITWLLVPA